MIKVANIIEEGRLGGPQIRITEVAKALIRSQKSRVRCQISDTRSQTPEIRRQRSEVRYPWTKESGRSSLCSGHSAVVEDSSTNLNDETNSANEEIETTVIFPKYESKDFRKKLEAYQIPYIQLPLHRLSKGWKYLLPYVLWFPIEIFLLWRELKKNKFDVVHASGGAWQVKGVIAGKLAGCRVLWHLNDTKMPGIVRAIFRVVARWCADGFIVAGERVRKYYVQELGFDDSKPFFEIQAPVNCSYFDPNQVQAGQSIAKRDGIKIVSVGNVNPLKGFEFFLYAAEQLSNLHNKLHFFIVGPHFSSQQTYSKKLEEIKENRNLTNVTFYGPSSDIRGIHMAADIYVCSSLAEASPLSVWEAMAMEKPVVATDVGDIIRFITHGENGYIVPPADSETLAHYVDKLIEHPELREQFGKKARQTAIEYLDITQVAKQHKEAYRWIYRNIVKRA